MNADTQETPDGILAQIDEARASLFKLSRSKDAKLFGGSNGQPVGPSNVLCK